MKIYFFALGAVALMAAAHFTGVHGAYEQWSSFYGYDNVVHFFGGLAIGFCVILFIKKIIPKFRIAPTFFTILVSVLAIGIAWEIFEAIYGISVLPGQAYWPDTFKDLVVDFIGGSCAWFIARKNI